MAGQLPYKEEEKEEEEKEERANLQTREQFGFYSREGVYQ